MRVNGDTLGTAQATASADLPGSGHARARSHVIRSGGAIENQFVLHDGTGSDTTHIALQDIHQLRQFVQAGATQEMSNKER